MLQITVSISKHSRAHPLPRIRSRSATINADLEIQFAGPTVSYRQVPFQLSKEGNDTEVTGTILATLSDFKIEPPTLLTLPVKNAIPIHVEITWHPQ